MIFFTFCVDIQKFPLETLLKVTNAWIDGLITSETPVRKAIIFTNLDLEIVTPHPFLELRPFDTADQLSRENCWVSLISQKFSYYKAVQQEFQENPIWLDLDTFVTGNLGYLEGIPEFCTVVGSEEARPMTFHLAREDYVVPRARMINTSVFRIGPPFLDEVSRIVDSESGYLALGDQDAFNIAYHFKGFRLPVLGADLYRDRLYSYSAWGKELAEHLNATNSNRLYFDEGGTLRSTVHPGSRVDMVQFTFNGAARMLRRPFDGLSPFLQHWRNHCTTRHVALRKN